MTGKDELRDRFDQVATDDDTEESDSDNTKNTDNTSQVDNTHNTGSTSKPGPDKDPDATRNRTQVPMYIDESLKEELNDLYDRLDGLSKVAGEGGISKHDDFMTEVAKLALDSDAELADRLDIDTAE